MEATHESNQRFVFYMEDGMGREYFLTDDDKFLPLYETTDQHPMEVASLPEISQYLKRLRKLHPASCRIFALERNEFNQLRTDSD